MKFLKKYNESKVNDELLELCKECFLDIKDEGADFDIDIDESDDSIIRVFIGFTTIENYDSLDEFYESKKAYFSYIELTKQSIDKLRNLYNSEIDIDFSYDKKSSGLESNHAIYLSISESLSSIGDFYKLKGNLCTINYSKLRNVLSLPPKVSISLATTGSYSLLCFYFSSKEEMRIYKDDLIERFSNLKIGNIFLNQPHSLDHSSGPKIKYKIMEDYNRHSSTGYYDRKKDIVNYIEFGLSTEIDYNW